MVCVTNKYKKSCKILKTVQDKYCDRHKIIGCKKSKTDKNGTRAGKLTVFKAYS
jgi:hypothetical protein